ncbi:MAG: FAD-binding protein [Gemmataceae bacterium]|nr:FAD-binding protein [Gemmataceae bacterium]MDW8265043.1 FAD-linked oxidase C-terminal domain-containing protein [Gemmataceae bacterium]
MPRTPLATVPELDVAALRAALSARIRGEVRFDRLSRALYSTDASVYQIVPLGVVVPRTADDLVAALTVCRQFRVPVTARGGGTSQAGQAIGPGVIVDCSKYLDQILEIRPDEKWVRVQPGVVLDDLNARLKPLGLHFPLDISTSNRATIGGMIANNSSGTRSIVYGKTVDHVLGLKVALCDGTVLDLEPLTLEQWQAKCRQDDREGELYRTVDRLVTEHGEEIERRYPKILRRVGGYNLDLMTRPGPTRNLAHLLVGSEGTLGLTLEARLNLVELPRARVVLVAQFHELLEALAATPVILEHQPSAVEVIDRYILDSTRFNAEAAQLRDFLQGDPGAILIIELSGNRAEELAPRLDALAADLSRRSASYHLHRALDPLAQARIWKLRKLALGLSMVEKGDAKAISFVEDTAVAPERLHDFIAEFLGLIRRHRTKAGVYAHASVGCLHVRPVVDLKTEAGLRLFEALAHEVADLVLRYGGALSGEHGDGLVRSPFQEKIFGPVLYQAFRQLKTAFDPYGLLNPGKIVDAPPLTANLRYGPEYVTPDVPTTFDFTADGGITRAAELCAGVGECRQRRDGTMCPSFQATRDEQHVTRGRANALRLALTGQAGLAGLTDPAIKDVLDLCLECKACKSECPTNVDMARLKAEVLHQYFRRHGLPWRNWLFGHIGSWSRWGCRLTPWSNRLAQVPWLRWLADRLLGLSRHRPLPPFAPRPLDRMPELRGRPPERAEVVFFPDTFVNYHEPAIGLAVFRLLDAAGVPVGWAAGVRCCGRPLISNGMLAEAVVHARHNVRCLWPWARAGKLIVACEPSCILTIRDDYPALLRGQLRKKAAAVASACLTFEEALDRLLSTRAALRFRPGPKQILVQGHCHQRSLVGMGPTLRLLRRIPGAEVADLDAGCCGLAGSFGYESEHYAISRLIGEQRLFPAVRRAPAEAVIVAAGFSCRSQIYHFLGREAQHPATILAEYVEGG